MNNFDINSMSQKILALAPDAILFSDREGVIRMWNSGAERIFGFKAEQAIGQSLDIIIPEKLRERHWDGYRKTMETGETRYGTELLAVPATNVDGNRLSTEFSIVLLTGNDGEPIGVAAIMRDVSERHHKEKQLRERLAELEAKHG